MKKSTANMPILGMVEWFRPGEYEHVERVLSDCRELNIKALRTGMSWADWHTPQAKTWYDWLIPTLAKEVEILPCFLYTPPSLGIAPKTSSPPENPKDFADFVDTIISEFGEYFEWVELWNEPNNKLEYDFTMDKHWLIFAEMVGGAAYWARQRGKKTVLGGMSPFDPNWLQLMYDRGVMKHIDAIGIHGFPDVFDQLWEGWEYYVDVTKKILEKNESNAEIWITEAGFSTWQYDEHRQLDEFRNAMKADVSRVYWYASQDLDPCLPTVGGFHTDDREYYFGLRRVDGTPKLLFRLLSEKGCENLFDLPYIKKINSLKEKTGYTLITGGAGFIGTNLAKKLMDAGKNVMILDNLSRPGVERNLQWLYENYPDQLDIHIADVRDNHTVNHLVRNASEVYHFAAQVAVTTSLDNPISDFDINARGTLNILQAIKAMEKPIPLIFTSTNKVYGGLEDFSLDDYGTRYLPVSQEIKNHGISELRPLDFHSPYGCSKGTADQYVLDFARTFNIPAVVFRMSCIYGEHQYGNEDQGWVAHFVIKALKGEPLTIYGDGKQVRDILFAEDLVNAFIIARENIHKISGEAFNMGGGPSNTTSLLEIVEWLKAKTGKELEVNFSASRPGDQLYYVSDIRKFAEATGWKINNDKDNGLDKLYDWLQNTILTAQEKELQASRKEAIL